MKLKVDKQGLLDSLKLVNGVLPPRSIHPVLSNILISAQEGEIHMLGTDQDITLEGTMTADIEEEGSIGLPARKMLDLLRKMDDGELSITTDNNRAIIEQGQGRFQIAGVKASDFPPVDIVGEIKDSFAMEKELLDQMIRSTSFAVSRDMARLSFSGLFFKISENKLTMVGTDGQRLILSEKITDTTNNPNEILIPSRTVDLIRKIFSSTENTEATVKLGRNTLKLECGEFSLQSKLITEKFPDYDQVIPRDNNKTLVADKNLLINTLSRVSVLANPSSNLVKFTLNGDMLNIASKDYELDTEAKEEMTVNYEGDEFKIGFSSKNLAEVLEHVTTQEVELTFNTPNSAVVLSPKDQPESENYLAILMPLRLTGED